MQTVLLYVAYNTVFTIAGLVLLMTSQNLQKEPAAALKFRPILIAAGLSIFLTPLVAWGISAIVRMRRIADASHVTTA